MAALQFAPPAAAQAGWFRTIRQRGIDTPTNIPNWSPIIRQPIAFRDLCRHLVPVLVDPAIQAGPRRLTHDIPARNVEFYLEFICNHQNGVFTFGQAPRMTPSGRILELIPTPFKTMGLEFMGLLLGADGNKRALQYIRTRYPELGRDGFRDGFFTFHYIFIPIYEHGQCSLLVICSKNSSVEYYDSLIAEGGYAPNRWQRYINLVLDFLKFDLGDAYVTNAWHYHHPVHKQQPGALWFPPTGSYNSAIYACANGFIVAFGFGFAAGNFTWAEVANKRKRMAVELLTGTLLWSLPAAAVLGQPEVPVHLNLGIQYAPATGTWAVIPGHNPLANFTQLTTPLKRAMRLVHFSEHDHITTKRGLKDVARAANLRPFNQFNGLTVNDMRDLIYDMEERKRFAKQRVQV